MRRTVDGWYTFWIGVRFKCVILFHINCCDLNEFYLVVMPTRCAFCIGEQFVKTVVKNTMFLLPNSNTM